MDFMFNHFSKIFAGFFILMILGMIAAFVWNCSVYNDCRDRGIGMAECNAMLNGRAIVVPPHYP